MKICYSCFSKLPAGAGVCPRCGCSADLKNEEKYPHALPCGSVLNGKYIVGRVLGQGGFGITYAGQEFNSKKLVAIKEYFPDTMASREQSSHSVVPFNTDRSKGFEYGKEQFLREAQTLSAFIGSPNIVRVYSFFEENGTAYFVMEYVRGQSLRQYLQSRGGRITWDQAFSLLMPMMDALSEVHSKNVIHRDIKPDNIIVTGEKRAKLIDFGAARYSYGEKSQSLTAILTHGYAPVEQYFSRGKQGPWTDVYALAATVYFCLTGKAPVDSVERAVMDSLEKPSELGIYIPEYVETALFKALAVKAEDRFSNIQEFRNEIQKGIEIEEERRREKEEKEREQKYGAASLEDAVRLLASERQDLEKEIQRLKEEKKRVDTEKKRLREERKLFESEKRLLEEEKESFKEEKRRFKEEMKRFAEERKLFGGQETVSAGAPFSEQASPGKAVKISDSWTEIISAGRDGSFRRKYRVGDTKDLNLGPQGIIRMKLAAIDEDELADGSGKAPMTWIADRLLRTEHNMNPSGTNEGGWEMSGMRAWLREYILPLMPYELQNNILKVKKNSCSYEGDEDIVTEDTVWIPSLREVFFASHFSRKMEVNGAVYVKTFFDDKSRTRRREGGSGSSWWWLRSAYKDYSYGFCYIYNDGRVYYDYRSDFEGGVVIGFCL